MDSNINKIEELERKLANTQRELKLMKEAKEVSDKKADDYRKKNYKLSADFEKMYDSYFQIANSKSWKLTKPMRFVLDGLKHIVRSNKYLFLMRKTWVNLRMYGFKATRLRIKEYLDKKEEVRQLLMDGKSFVIKDRYEPYESEYQDNVIFEEKEKDVKALAFYLPQFHSFPENDEWWGEGFTEWNNTTKSFPRYMGHYQPRTPHEDIGYYDLSDFETMRKQIELAKQHGLYGFCFYYYWFSGKRLMEKPVDLLLEHPEVDFPFCLCWANENWTRAWDGQTRNVLIAQDYSDEDDIRFMDDMKKYIDDSRYIRINGKPLVIVYNPGQIPNCGKSFNKWRERAKENGIGEILIWTCQTANNTVENLGIQDYVDGELEFPPHNMWFTEIAMRNIDLNGKSANIYNYQLLVDIIASRLKNSTQNTKVPMHHACMMGWDNAARRANAWTTYNAYSLRSFYKWLRALMDDARRNLPEEERFIFVNAWNEWAEGTYLEPDEKYGYANINTFSKAIYDLPFEESYMHVFDKVVENDRFVEKEQPRIAVQAHMFYLETMEDIIPSLNEIPYSFDCYISTDTDEKAVKIRAEFEKSCTAKNVFVKVCENRGRDVGPFLEQMNDAVKQYDYIGHIHSKKTKTGDYGDGWRKYLFKHLFGNSEYLKCVFNEFEADEKLGILFPETYPLLIKQAEWGGNKPGCETLLKKLNIEIELPDEPVFPVGNMFWAKTEAVKSLFDARLTQKDFPEEAGQVNLTLGHQIERIWVYLAKNNGFKFGKIFNNFAEKYEKNVKRCSVYVHYDSDNVISDNDVEYFKRIQNISDKTVFVTNSLVSDKELDKIRLYADEIIQRENEGYDFGGWKAAINKIGWNELQKYEQLLLTNNSLVLTKIPFESMFSEMDAKICDFWGVTEFPYLNDGSFIGKDCIPKHLQSFFQVYNTNAISNSKFQDFWDNMVCYNEYEKVVGNQETQLTKKLEDEGLIGEPYLLDSAQMCGMIGNYSLPFSYPYEMCVLGMPFIKKKAFNLADMQEIDKLNVFLN